MQKIWPFSIFRKSRRHLVPRYCSYWHKNKRNTLTVLSNKKSHQTFFSFFPQKLPQKTEKKQRKETFCNLSGLLSSKIEWRSWQNWKETFFAVLERDEFARQQEFFVSKKLSLKLWRFWNQCDIGKHYFHINASKNVSSGECGFDDQVHLIVVFVDDNTIKNVGTRPRKSVYSCRKFGLEIRKVSIMFSTIEDLTVP